MDSTKELIKGIRFEIITTLNYKLMDWISINDQTPPKGVCLFFKDKNNNTKCCLFEVLDIESFQPTHWATSDTIF